MLKVLNSQCCVSGHIPMLPSYPLPLTLKKPLNISLQLNHHPSASSSALILHSSTLILPISKSLAIKKPSSPTSASTPPLSYPPSPPSPLPSNAYPPLPLTSISSTTPPLSLLPSMPPLQIFYLYLFLSVILLLLTLILILPLLF